MYFQNEDIIGIRGGDTERGENGDELSVTRGMENTVWYYMHYTPVKLYLFVCISNVHSLHQKFPSGMTYRTSNDDVIYNLTFYQNKCIILDTLRRLPNVT